MDENKAGLLSMAIHIGNINEVNEDISRSWQFCTQLIKAWTGFEPWPLQLSYQANWELVMIKLWVRKIPLDGERHKWMYESL